MIFDPADLRVGGNLGAVRLHLAVIFDMIPYLVDPSGGAVRLHLAVIFDRVGGTLDLRGVQSAFIWR